MDALAELEEALRETLGHLYDPSYWPPGLLWTAMGCDPQRGLDRLRAALLENIESLKPGPEVPPAARIRRLYDLLVYRYVQDHTQEETAGRLGITSRHLRREQQEALSLLARHLQERQQAVASRGEPSAAGGDPGPDGGQLEAQSPEWRSQLKQEMAALQRSAPGMVANVGEVIQNVREVARTLISRHGISLTVEDTRPDLLVAIHPSALGQVLLAAIGKLAEVSADGQITCSVTLAGERVCIAVMGRPVASAGPIDTGLVREILAAEKGDLEVCVDAGQVSLLIRLVPVAEIKVLVVDDNRDVVHFYERYTTGTRYRILAVSEGQRVLQTIETYAPDVIVLDVMLPDIDGWALLSHLHENPTTHSVPIIVCSVIQQDELALALGAAICLTKPVWRSDFVRALDRAAARRA